MRNKNYGLTQHEIKLVKQSNPLALSQMYELLNAPTLSRYQYELVVKAIKYNACQHILNAEKNRFSVSHECLINLKILVTQASKHLGFDIYTEYVAECRGTDHSGHDATAKNLSARYIAQSLSYTNQFQCY